MARIKLQLTLPNGWSEEVDERDEPVPVFDSREVDSLSHGLDLLAAAGEGELGIYVEDLPLHDDCGFGFLLKLDHSVWDAERIY